MRHLGIDYGTKRIGVAVSDDEGRVAFPLATVEAGRGAVSAVAELARAQRAGKVVLGESRDFRGERNTVMEDIEQFKKDIEELTRLPVVYEAEFLTSAAAARQFAPDAPPVGTGLRPRESRKENPSQEKLDSSAAALILQSYLDRTNATPSKAKEPPYGNNSSR